MNSLNRNILQLFLDFKLIDYWFQFLEKLSKALFAQRVMEEVLVLLGCPAQREYLDKPNDTELKIFFILFFLLIQLLYRCLYFLDV